MKVAYRWRTRDTDLAMMAPGLLTLLVLVTVLLRTRDEYPPIATAHRRLPWGALALCLAMVLGSWISPRWPYSLHPTVRWLVSPWIHTDLFHRAGNVVVVAGLGWRCEPRLGVPRVWFLFCAGALIGNLANEIQTGPVAVLGASGGAYAMLAYLAFGSPSSSIRWLAMAILVLQGTCAVAFPSAGTAFTAHAVGGTVGWLFGMLPGYRDATRAEASTARALHWLEAGRPALAAGILRRHVATYPRDRGGRWLLVDALEKSGDFQGASDAAVEVLRTCLRDPSSPTWIEALPDPATVTWTGSIPLSSVQEIAERFRGSGNPLRAASWLESHWKWNSDDEGGVAAGTAAARVLWRDCERSDLAIRLLDRVLASAPDGPAKENARRLRSALGNSTGPLEP